MLDVFHVGEILRENQTEGVAVLPAFVHLVFDRRLTARYITHHGPDIENARSVVVAVRPYTIENGGVRSHQEEEIGKDVPVISCIGCLFRWDVRPSGTLGNGRLSPI